MKLPAKSKNTTNIDISHYYALKVGSIWKGLKQESAAFWWLCIYLVFEYVRPQSIYPMINVLPWAQLSLILVVVTAFFDKSVKWVKSPGNVLISLFFIIVLLSSVFAFHPSTAWNAIDIVVNWVVVYFLIINIVNTEKRFFIFFLLFLLVNFKMSQNGAISFASSGFAYSNWGLVGAPGWFSNAGDYGVAMLIFVPLSIAFVLALKSCWGPYKRLFFYLLPLTGLITIIGTSSRGVQLGLVGIGFWFLLKSGKGIKAAAAILIVGWMLYLLLPEEMLEEYRSAGEDHTSQDRLIHWAFGMDVVRDHPGLGVGYKNWLVYCNYVNPNGLGYNSKCRLPHNTYITAASEIGITGFVMYLLMILLIFIQNARTRLNAKQNDNKFVFYTAHGLDAGLVGYLISSIFFTVLFYPVFWIHLAMTIAIHDISKRQLKRQTSVVRRVDAAPQKAHKTVKQY